jgi:hypothetical protein
MQKDFDNVVVESARKERLHAVPDDAGSRGGDSSLGSRSGAGSGGDFMNVDSATPLLKEQQRVQVLRVGGKEVIQHDVAAVEAVRTRVVQRALDNASFVFLLKPFLPFLFRSNFIFPTLSSFSFSQQFQQEQLSAFSRLESDLAGLAEVYQEVAILTVEQGVAINEVTAAPCSSDCNVIAMG